MNQIGIYYAYWEREWEADFSPYLQKVKKLGFDVLELAAGSLLEMSEGQRRRLAAGAKETGLELTYCIGLPPEYDMASLDGTVRRNGIEYMKRLLEAIYQMGGSLIGGIIYAAWPGVPRTGIADKTPWWDQSVESVREVSQTARDYGILYCLEIVNRYEQFLLNTAAEGMRFLREVESPNVKLLLDAFHMNIEEDCIGESILAAGDAIGHFHIGECNRKVPGKGHMPWREIADALKGAGYQGKIVMEPFVRMGGTVGQNIKVWRNLAPEAESGMDQDAREALEFIRGLFTEK